MFRAFMDELKQIDNMMDSIYSIELQKRGINLSESGAVSVDYIIGMVIAIFVFFAVFPSALASFFAVRVDCWTHYNPTTEVYEADVTAITLWNLLPYIIIVFGGIMLFIRYKGKN